MVSPLKLYLLALAGAFAINLLAALVSRLRARATRRREAPDGRPAGRPSRLLVIGASGGTGRQLVARALARGHRVTALVRNPDRFALADPNLRVVRGDVLDAATLEAALADQDAVLSALGHKRWLHPTRILSTGTGNLLGAMERRGVRRLVCVTSLGVAESWWRMGLWFTLLVRPLILPFYFRDKARQEALIRASPLDWTIVRPAALTDGPARGGFRHGAAVGNPLWTERISRADVADFMLDQLSTPAYLRAAPGLAW